MGTADRQIRVSETVKRELDDRRREDESFNDVVERLLEDDRDLLVGFGAFGETDRAESIRVVHEEGREKSEERIAAIAEGRTDE